MTAIAEALSRTHPNLVATSRLATMAINALRRTDDVERAAQRVSDLLIDEEPLMAELFGHDAVRSAVRRLIFNCARDMAGHETDGAAHSRAGADGSSKMRGTSPSTPSETAHGATSADGVYPGRGCALNPIGGERPKRDMAKLVQVRGDPSAEPHLDDAAQGGRGGDAHLSGGRVVEIPSSSGAHGAFGNKPAQTTSGVPARPNPSHRTLASVSGTATTAASGLLYTFRLRDGRVLGSVRWDELPEIAKAGERETKIVRRLMGHAAYVPSGARVADVVSEATLAQFVKEIDDAS